jgi:hypothetical protein
MSKLAGNIYLNFAAGRVSLSPAVGWAERGLWLPDADSAPVVAIEFRLRREQFFRIRERL